MALLLPLRSGQLRVASDSDLDDEIVRAREGVRVMERIERPLRLHRDREHRSSGSRTSTHSCLVPCRQSSRTRVPFDERSASHAARANRRHHLFARTAELAGGLSSMSLLLRSRARNGEIWFLSPRSILAGAAASPAAREKIRELATAQPKSRGCAVDAG